MGARRAIPPDAEVMMRRGMEPVLVKGGGTVKALSAEFLADLQVHWRKNRDQILDDVAKKYPQQYFAGMVALARTIRWEIGTPGDFERQRSPEEIMQKLEERVGPEGRKISRLCLQSEPGFPFNAFPAFLRWPQHSRR